MVGKVCRSRPYHPPRSIVHLEFEDYDQRVQESQPSLQCTSVLSLLTKQRGGLGGTQAELGFKELGAERGHAGDERGFGCPRQAEQDEGGIS